MNKLLDIAEGMKTEAKRCGRAERLLSRGLAMRLSCVGGFWTLVLARSSTMPSENEVSICRHAFGVPANAKRADASRSVWLRWSTDPSKVIASG